MQKNLISLKSKSFFKRVAKLLLSKSTFIYWAGLITFFLSIALAKHHNFTKYWFSRGFYPIIAHLLSHFNSWFPFSLSDLFYTTLILYIIISTLLIMLLKKKRKLIIGITLKLIVLIYVMFYWLWGFNYFQPDIYSRISINSKKHTSEQFSYTIDHLILVVNQQREMFTFFKNQNIDSIIEITYKKESGFLAIDYPMGKRRTKSFLYPKYMSAASIGGYIGPFFNEVHTNPTLLPIQIPVVLAHEKAHQFGIASESEANFYAWYICSKSGYNDLMYSANLYLLRHFLSYAKTNKPDFDYTSKLSPKVTIDLKEIHEHWQALHINTIDAVSTFIYDKYLRFNKIDKGINDYGGVVQLIIDYGYFN